MASIVVTWWILAFLRSVVHRENDQTERQLTNLQQCT